LLIGICARGHSFALDFGFGVLGDRNSMQNSLYACQDILLLLISVQN